MFHTQSPRLSDQCHERDVDTSDLDAGRESSDQRIGSTERYRPRTGMSSRSASFKTDRVTSDRPSIARRIFRALARFFFAVLIGIGVTLAWQSYGDAATEVVRDWAPSLSWLLPVSTTKPSAPAVTSAEVQQQFKPLALDLAIVRRSVEQLAANQDQLARKQEQTAQSIAILQAAEQQLVQKVLSPPQSKPVRVPPHQSLQPPAQ